MKSYLEQVRDSAPFSAYKERLQDLLSLKSGERLLDIGCGLGDDVRDAANTVAPGGIAIGVEKDTETLAALGAGLDWPNGASFVAGDAASLPFGDRSFDVVRIDRVLHMLVNSSLALSETYRVLAPGGRVLVAEPDWASLRLIGLRLQASPVTRRIQEDAASGAAVAAFDPQSLAKAVGFEITHSQSMNVKFTNLSEARTLLHLDRTVFALRLRKEISTDVVADWLSSLQADFADGSFAAHLSGAVLLLSRCDNPA